MYSSGSYGRYRVCSVNSTIFSLRRASCLCTGRKGSSSHCDELDSVPRLHCLYGITGVDCPHERVLTLDLDDVRDRSDVQLGRHSRDQALNERGNVGTGEVGGVRGGGSREQELTFVEERDEREGGINTKNEDSDKILVFSLAPKVKLQYLYTFSEHITLIWDWVWFKCFDVDQNPTHTTPSPYS